MNIYGHFYVWYHSIHYVTFVGIIVLGVYYLYRFRSMTAPFLMKILLPCLYVFGGIVHYEIMWNFVWMLYWPVVFLDVVGFSICGIMLMYTIRLMKNKFGYDIPQVNPRRLVIVTGIMVVMIVWLFSTGFYHIYKQVHLGQTTVDPHNFAWAVGKITCLLSWLWIPDSSLGGFSPPFLVPKKREETMSLVG